MDKLEIAKKLFFDGINSINNKEYQKAEEQFLKSLELIPDKESVLCNLSAAQISLKKYKEARESSLKAILLKSENPIAFQNLGVIEQEEYNHEEAIKYFDKAIACNQNFSQAWNNKAISFSELGLYEDAIKFYDIAIKLNPNLIEAYNNKGDVLVIKKKYDEALLYYEKTILINPAYPPSWVKKGDLLSTQKKYEAAVECYNAALEIDNKCIEAWCQKSLAFVSLKNYQEALNVSNQANKINNNYPEIWANKSLILVELQRYEEALEACNAALILNSNFAIAWNNKGLCYYRLKQYEESHHCYDKAIKINKNYFVAWHNKSLVYFAQKLYPETIFCCDEVFKTNDNAHEAWMSKGSALNEMKKFDEALACYNKSLELEPNNSDCLNNKGLLLHLIGLNENNKNHLYSAKKLYDQAIELNPQQYKSYWNKSLTNLTLGEFEEGWKNYFYRWKDPDGEVKLQFKTISRLNTLENIRGKKILVWSEQGLGDAIQFSRYLKKLIELGAEIIFEVPKPLLNLMSGQFNCSVIAKGSFIDQNAVNFQIPLLDLPLLFNTTIDSIPFKESYLKTKITKDIEWKNKLQLPKNKLNIAITCAGNKDYKGDSYRSTKVSSFAPLINRANLFLIQKDITSEDEIFIKNNPEIKFIGKNITDFEDLASVIQNMDLVVTTDTSIPHLSCAIGKKTYILLSAITDWRWGLDINFSPWYNAATLLRKKNINEDWKNLVTEAAKNLPSLNQN